MPSASIETTILIIAIVVVLVLFGIFFILMLLFYSDKKRKILHDKLVLQNNFHKELSKMQLETQEQTFHDISTEIHDNIGQLLSSAKLLLGIAQRQPHATTYHTLPIAEETLSKAIYELRALSKSLNTTWLTQFNFIENMEAEVNRINRTNLVKASFYHTGQELNFSIQQQLILFRIVQEALQNCLKHAKSSSITIELICLKKETIITVEDNGIGFPTASVNHKGLGLHNMKYRTQLLGGHIEWKPVNPHGTKVYISLPNSYQLLI